MGPVTFFQLLSRFGSAKSALAALPSLSQRAGGKRLRAPDNIDQELEQVHRYGAKIICACEADFPSALKQFSPPPPLLTILGDPDHMTQRCVAIVGARQASAVGRKLARDIAADLSESGFKVVSGLARGIDGEAHAASLQGGTIAVLGGGIDHIYPQQHQRLYAEIAEKGVLVSESPFGHRATARDFPRRNRIITGLAEGVVIIEAAERSGSLISARTALEQNREVMAVPGSPLEPRCAGSNRLLRDGATLIRNAEDVIEALMIPSTRALEAPTPPIFHTTPDFIGDLPEAQIAAVRNALSLTPIPMDELARAASIGLPRCAVILVELELAGIAVTFPSGLAALAIETEQP